MRNPQTYGRHAEASTKRLAGRPPSAAAVLARGWAGLLPLSLILALAATLALAASAGASRRAAPRRASPHRRASSRRAGRRPAPPAPCSAAVPAPVTAHSAAAANAAQRIRRIVNPFGSAMFGVATYGWLQNESTPSLDRDLKADRLAGARWLRVNIDWATIQDRGPRSFFWRPVDRLVEAARACGIHVLGNIDYTPSWARPPGTPASWHPPAGPLAAFAAAAAHHYRRLGVHAWEIWNEPNQGAWWSPKPDPAGYAEVLRAIYPAIHGGDPSATVVTGGTAPAPNDAEDMTPMRFLAGVYAAGGKGYFDAVGHHPYSWPAMPGSSDAWSAWHQMVAARKGLRALMISHGDGAKRIWGTEFGAPTGGPPGSYVSEAKQAAIITRGFALWATYSWAGPLFVYSGRDAGYDTSTREDSFGFLHADFAPKPAYAAMHWFAAAFDARMASGHASRTRRSRRG